MFEGPGRPGELRRPLDTGFVDKFFKEQQGYRSSGRIVLPAIDFAADEVAVLGLPPATGARRGSRPPPPTTGQAEGCRAQLRPGAARQRSHTGRRGARLRGDVEATVRRPPSSSTTAGPASATPPPPRRAMGRGHGGGVDDAGLDTDHGEPSCPGSAGSSPRWRRRGHRVVHGPGGHRPARPPGRSRRSSRTERVVLARSGAANGLRRRAAVSATRVTGPDGTPEWDQPQWPRVGGQLAGELLGTPMRSSWSHPRLRGCA